MFSPAIIRVLAYKAKQSVRHRSLCCLLLAVRCFCHLVDINFVGWGRAALARILKHIGVRLEKRRMCGDARSVGIG